MIPLCGAPRVDLFCLWSTETDGVAVAQDGVPAVGTRADLEAWWQEEYGRHGRAAEVFARAATTGTAAQGPTGWGPPFGSWQDTELPVRDLVDGRLARARLGDYLRALADGDLAAAVALINPIERM